MSAHLRGLVLDATAERLVIQASASEVAQFARQARVAVADALTAGSLESLAAENERLHARLRGLADIMSGSDMPSSWREGMGWMDRMRVEAQRQIGAILRTACGATKVDVVPYPPRHTIRVALMLPIRSLGILDETAFPSMTYREFQLAALEHNEQNYRVRAVYNEVLS